MRSKPSNLALLLATVVLLGGLSAVAGPLNGDHHTTIFFKGGVGKFAGGPLDGESAPWAPVFGLGIGFQLADFFGLDLMYEGGRIEYAGPITDGSGEHAARWKHGADILLKFGGPVGDVVYPYVGAGFGATWLVSSGPFSSGVPVDALLEVPVAIGIDLRSKTILAGLRFSYRFLLDQWVAYVPGERDDTGGFIDLQLIIGFRF